MRQLEQQQLYYMIPPTSNVQQLSNLSKIDVAPVAPLGIVQRQRQTTIGTIDDQIDYNTDIRRSVNAQHARQYTKEILDEVKYTRKLKGDLTNTTLYKVCGETSLKVSNEISTIRKSNRKLEKQLNAKTAIKKKYSCTVLGYFITITAPPHLQDKIIPYFHHITKQSALADGSWIACIEWSNPEEQKGTHIHLLLDKREKPEHRKVKACLEMSYQNMFGIQPTSVQMLWEYAANEQGMQMITDYIHGKKAETKMEKQKLCISLREQLDIPHIYDSSTYYNK